MTTYRGLPGMTGETP